MCMFVDNNCKAFHIFLAFTVKQICSPVLKVHVEFQLIRYPYHIRILKFVEGTSRQILTHHSLKFDILSKMIKPIAFTH